MSIWADLEEHKGTIPFFGSPMFPSIKNGQMILWFPKGYKNNTLEEMNELAVKLNKMVGKKIVSVSLKKVVVEINNTKASYAIADCFIQSNP